MLNNFLFAPKSYRLWYNVGKYGTVRDSPDDNKTRMRIARRLNKDTDTQSQGVIIIAFPRQK
jgi:hypothetical protein